MLLRPTSLADLDVFLSWIPDEESMVLWTGPTFSWPLSRFQLERYLTNASRQYWTGIHETTGAVLGHGTLLFDGEALTCRLGSIIVDPSRRGEGLGRELVELLKAKAYGTSTVKELTLGVIAHNSAARSLYESLGFRGSEVLRRMPVGGQVWEAVSMRHSRELPY